MQGDMVYGIPNTKNINKAKNDFVVVKKINGKAKYLGRGKTLIIALMKRDWCEANNWKPYPLQSYSIRKNTSGTYTLTKKKRINGTSRSVYSANFPTFEEAEAEAKLLEKYDWDIEKLCECVDETENGEKWLEGKYTRTTFQTKPRNDFYMAYRSDIL